MNESDKIKNVKPKDEVTYVKNHPLSNDNNGDSLLQGLTIHKTHVPPVSPQKIEKGEQLPVQVRPLKVSTELDKLGALLDKRLEKDNSWKQNIDKKYDNYEMAKNEGPEAVKIFIKDALNVIYKKGAEKGGFTHFFDDIQDTFISRWEKMENVLSKALKTIPEKVGEMYAVLTRGIDAKGEISKTEKPSEFEKFLKEKFQDRYEIVGSIGDVVSQAGLVMDSVQLVEVSKNFAQFKKIMKELSVSFRELEKEAATTKDPIIKELYLVYKANYENLKILQQKLGDSVKSHWLNYALGYGGQITGHALKLEEQIVERAKKYVIATIEEAAKGSFSATKLLGAIAFIFVSVLAGIAKWVSVYKMRGTRKDIEKYQECLQNIVYQHKLSPKELEEWQKDQWIKENYDIEKLSSILILSESPESLYENLKENDLKIHPEQLVIEQGRYFVKGDKNHQKEISLELFAFLAGKVRAELQGENKVVFEKRLKSVFSKKIEKSEDYLLLFQLKELVINKSVFHRLVKNLIEDSQLKILLKEVSPTRLVPIENIKNEKIQFTTPEEERRQVIDNVIEKRQKMHAEAVNSEIENVKRAINEIDPKSDLNTIMEKLKEKGINLAQLKVDYEKEKGFYLVLENRQEVSISNDLAVVLDPRLAGPILAGDALKNEKIEVVLKLMDEVIESKLRELDPDNSKVLRRIIEQGKGNVLVAQYDLEKIREIKKLIDNYKIVSEESANTLKAAAKDLDETIIALLEMKCGKEGVLYNADNIEEFYKEIEPYLDELTYRGSYLFEKEVEGKKITQEISLGTGEREELKKLLMQKNALLQIENLLLAQSIPKIDLEKAKTNLLDVVLKQESVQQELASQKAHKEEARTELVSKGLKTAYSANLENKKSIFKGEFFQKLVGAIGFTGITTSVIVVKLILVFAAGSAVILAGTILPFLLFASAAFTTGLMIFGVIYMVYKNPELSKASIKLIPLKLSLGNLEKGLVEKIVRSKASKLDPKTVGLINKLRIESKDVRAIKDIQAQGDILNNPRLKEIVVGVLGEDAVNSMTFETEIRDAFLKKIPSQYESYMNYLKRLNYLDNYNQNLENQLGEHAQRDLEKLEGFVKRLENGKVDPSWNYFANLMEGIASGKAIEDEEIGQILKLHGINPAELSQKMLEMKDKEGQKEVLKWLQDQFNVHLLREGGVIVSYYKGVMLKENQRISNERFKVIEEQKDPNVLVIEDEEK